METTQPESPVTKIDRRPATTRVLRSYARHALTIWGEQIQAREFGEVQAKPKFAGSASKRLEQLWGTVGHGSHPIEIPDVTYTGHVDAGLFRPGDDPNPIAFVFLQVERFFLDFEEREWKDLAVWIYRSPAGSWRWQVHGKCFRWRERCVVQGGEAENRAKAIFQANFAHDRIAEIPREGALNMYREYARWVYVDGRSPDKFRIKSRGLREDLVTELALRIKQREFRTIVEALLHAPREKVNTPGVHEEARRLRVMMIRRERVAHARRMAEYRARQRRFGWYRWLILLEFASVLQKVQ